MTPGLFVTGTNTGVGKTAVAAAILRLLAAEGVRAVGLKPIASGSERRRPGEPLRNADALELQAAAPVPLPYETVNPWCFEPAIAPHLAAEEAGLTTPLDLWSSGTSGSRRAPSSRSSKARAAGACRCTRTAS